MKWIIFSGTALVTNRQVENDVRSAVRKVLKEKNGIITGGAVGVDYYTMHEVYKLRKLKFLRVILPTKFEIFLKNYVKLKNDIPGKIEATKLVRLLKKIHKACPTTILEMKFKEVTLQTLYDRDTEEVKYGDELYAFHVNNSKGTQDTIDKAKKAGMKRIVEKKYQITI